MFDSAAKASPGKVQQSEVVPAAVPQVLALLDAAEREDPTWRCFSSLPQ